MSGDPVPLLLSVSMPANMLANELILPFDTTLLLADYGRARR